MIYTVSMRDEHGGSDSCEIEADSVKEAWTLAEEATEEWCRGGEWGSDGASVECWYSLEIFTDADLLEIDKAIDHLTNITLDGYPGVLISEIESGNIKDGDLPDFLIAAAKALSVARREIVKSIEELSDEEYTTVDVPPDHEILIRSETKEGGCGDDPDDHDWTSEGEGGLDSNPGCWSTGGTSMVFHSHCKTCGLHRIKRHTGSQRNPGETDSVEYDMPSSWCLECQSVDCECDP